MKICTAEQMRTLDALAIDKYNVPGLDLMENAGQGTVDCIVERFGDPLGKNIAIFVGPGNNGGDGLVIARLLHHLGGLPSVFMLVPTKNMRGDAAINLKELKKLPVPLYSITNIEQLTEAESHLSDIWLVIDSIFGTGLTRKVNGHFAEIINRINEFTCPLVAVDIPSGLHTDSGLPLGCSVKADLTVTFGLAKIGQIIHPGSGYTGELQVVDIGIPHEAVLESHIKTEALDKSVFELVPARSKDSHKGTFGHLLEVAGSQGKTGAAILCALGALRSGTGLVSLCVPNNINSIFEATLFEAMTIPLPESDSGFISFKDWFTVYKALEGKSAVVIGPGIGTENETASLVRKLYTESELPMIVDADALNILAMTPEIIKTAKAPRILTPHPGEMSRLANISKKDIQADRITTAQAFAVENNVYLILKGSDTVVAAPDGRVAINTTGNPGMAAGGMGDVLSGIIGGLLAQCIDSWEACILGVYSHGAAGDMLAEKTGGFGYLASELSEELPLVLNG